MRASRKGVHVVAREAIGLAVLLGGGTHRDRVEPAHERILIKSVLGRHAAVLVSLTSTHKEVGRTGHRLHATGDDDLVVPGANRLIGQRHGNKARQAQLVDGGGGYRHRDTGSRGRGARGIGSGTGLHDIAHDHRIDLIGSDTRPLQRATDSHGTEFNRRQRREDAEQLADRGACSVDDHRSGHGVSSVPSNTWMSTRGFEGNAPNLTHRARPAPTVS